MNNDELLLEQLGAALFSEPDTEPPMAVFAAMHRSINNPAPVKKWGAHRVLVGVAVGISTLGASGAAYAATGTTLPPVVREVAHAAHLPVDSPAVAQARDSRRRLRDALNSHNDAEIVRAANDLRADLNQLDSAERDALEPESNRLLEHANDHSGSSGGADTSHNNDGSNAPGTAPDKSHQDNGSNEVAPSETSSSNSGSDQPAPTNSGNQANSADSS